MVFVWSFCVYGFLGYLLEKGFARLKNSPKQRRKAFLFAPICPAYGFAMLLALLLGAGRTERVWEQMLVGGSAATAVEYGLHWFYERVFGVHFWDYGTLRFEVAGRIALPFSILWGILSFLALRGVQPLVEVLCARMPAALGNALLLFLAVDAMYTFRALWLYGDTECLTPAVFVRCVRE